MMKVWPVQLTLDFHELPLVPGHLVPSGDLFIIWASFGQVVDALHQSWVETVPEREAELQTVRVVGLLHQGSERVDVLV